MASHKLSRLDIFKDMRFVIDRESEEGDNLIVRVQVKECKYKLHAGTEVQKGQIGVGVGGTIYNVFGRAERLDVNAALGSQSATPLSVQFTKPISADPDRVFGMNCFSTLQHYVDGVSFKNRLQGFSASYSFPTMDNQVKHNVKYALDWRHVFGISEEASVTVRRNAGHSLKSSISHVMSLCTRDSAVFPTRGVFARLSTEVAGLGGSTSFLKGDLAVSGHVPLYKQIVLGVGARIGHIRPLLHQKLNLIDKYQLGGPLSVRGFALNSLGPKDRCDSVGGDMSAESSLGMSFPLSRSTVNIVRGHLFANAGVLLEYSHGTTFKGNCSQWAKTVQPNVSVGAGLQVKLGNEARLEMNIAYPICMQPSAVFHRGLQVGFGVEFL